MRLEDLQGPECDYCGGELDPDSKQTRFCCDSHYKLYYKLIKRRLDQEKWLKEKASWNRRCPVCDVPIPPEARADRIYCSTKCSHSVMIYRHRGSKRLAARSNKTCEHCGKLFTLSKGNARHCSSRCQKAAWQIRKRAEKKIR